MSCFRVSKFSSQEKHSFSIFDLERRTSEDGSVWSFLGVGAAEMFLGNQA